ncbi:MAG: hypothetical protein QM762_07075 [Chryseolinea sp.]
MMKGIFTLVFCLGVSYVFGQATNAYRSNVTTGNWSTVGSWQRWNGSTWVTATQAPTNTNAQAVTILNGHTITVTDDRSIDQATVDAGGAVVVNSGVTFTIANGTGDDFAVNGTVTVGGTLQIASNAVVRTAVATSSITVNGTLNNAGSIANSSAARVHFATGSIYNHENTTPGVVPAADWQNGSNCRITADVIDAPGGLSQSFYDFEWDTPDLSFPVILNGALTTVRHDLTFTDTGGQRIILSDGVAQTLNVGGNMVVSTNGLVGINTDANSTVNVTGNLDLEGGSLGLSYGTGSVTMVVGGSVLLNGGIFETSGVYNTLGYSGTGNSNISIAGSYTNNAASVRKTGGATQFDMAFTGAGTHSFTSTPVPTFPINYAVTGTGNLDIAATSRLAGPGTFNLASTARVTLRSTSSQGAYRTSVAQGNVQVSGTRTVAGTVVYGGTALQRISPETPTNVTTIINNTSHVRMLSDIDFTPGTLGLTAGNLQIRQFTLTVSNVDQLSGRLQVQNTSKLIINGTGAYGNVAGNNPTGALLLSGNQIGSLTINKTSGGFVTKTGTLTIASLLDLQNGNLALGATTTTVNGNFAATGRHHDRCWRSSHVPECRNNACRREHIGYIGDVDHEQSRCAYSYKHGQSRCDSPERLQR